MNWINDWTGLDDARTYLACPVNARPDGTLYLGQPIGIQRGWEVRRLREGCYAAIELPPWEPPATTPPPACTDCGQPATDRCQHCSHLVCQACRPDHDAKSLASGRHKQDETPCHDCGAPCTPPGDYCFGCGHYVCHACANSNDHYIDGRHGPRPSRNQDLGQADTPNLR